MARYVLAAVLALVSCGGGGDECTALQGTYELVHYDGSGCGNPPSPLRFVDGAPMDTECPGEAIEEGGACDASFVTRCRAVLLVEVDGNPHFGTTRIEAHVQQLDDGASLEGMLAIDIVDGRGVELCRGNVGAVRYDRL